MEKINLQYIYSFIFIFPLPMFTLAPLPYGNSDLEPIIDTQTIEFHYGKHHQGYVQKINELIVGTPYENQSLEDIIKSAEGPIFNNAAQIRNHTFYWNGLQAPKEDTLPIGTLADAITAQRGDFQKFQEAMTTSAVGNFGSGWTWLVKNSDGTLEIINTSNAGCPLTSNKKALLTIDVREHAYYLKYQNRRIEYVTNIWKCINRARVNDLFNQ